MRKPTRCAIAGPVIAPQTGADAAAAVEENDREIPGGAGLERHRGKRGSSIFLTADGRVILQGRAVAPQARQALGLPADGDMISVDRNLIQAIKDML